MRQLLAALTNALSQRGPYEVIYLDGARVHVDAALEDAETRRAPRGHVVPPPDGLFEWRVRRDFVRALPAGTLKRRLGDTLGGTRTRRRFEVTLGNAHEAHEAFRLFRRRRLRAYAARVIRYFSLIESSTSSANGIDR